MIIQRLRTVHQSREESELILQSPHFREIGNIIPADLCPAFGVIARANLHDSPFLSLEGTIQGINGYIQAKRVEEGWWVEVRNVTNVKHYRSDDVVSQSTACMLFGDFLLTGMRVLNSWQFTDVTKEVEDAIRYWKRRRRRGEE